MMFKVSVLIICFFSLLIPKITRTALEGSSRVLDVIERSTSPSKIIRTVLEKSIRVFNDNERPTRVRTAEQLKNNKNAVYDFIGLVEQYEGYKAEEYSLTTSDGYILKLHRVYASPLSPESEVKRVVLIGPGLFTSSDFYVDLGADHDLVYRLADNGYDIWIGNIRGTSYSLEHIKYSHNDPKFWEFSLNEAALIDTPAFIDFVLNKTGQKDLTYIGYSMGSTQGFMLLSSKLEYNNKINMFICLAPVVYFVPPINPLTKTIFKTMVELGRKGRVNELFPQSTVIAAAADTFCTIPFPNICAPLVDVGAQSDKMNITYALPKISRYAPAGSGYHIVEHYYQMVQSQGKFQAYDYDKCKFSCKSRSNREMYNQTKPPQYDVSLVTARTFLFQGLSDSFTTNKNVERLAEKLKNLQIIFIVNDKKFNHIDFFWNLQAPSLVYTPLLTVMDKYLNK